MLSYVGTWKIDQMGSKQGTYVILIYFWVYTYIFTEKPQFSREYVTNKMLPEMKELAELVEPHVWWSDGDWEAKPEYW